MIRAVFFDYDGVLTTDKTGSLTTNRYLSHASGVDFSSVKAAFSQYNNDLTLGKTTYAQIWPEVCHKLGCELSISLLYEAFESTPMNAPMFLLARRLQGAYSLGIITDNKKDRIDCLKKHQDLASLFNPIIVSSEVGLNKESTEIFLHALECMNVAPEESIFIDNNSANLIAPRTLGINTIFHDDELNDIDALVRSLTTHGVCVRNA